MKSKKSVKQEQAKTLSSLTDYYAVCNRCEGKSPKTIEWYTANLQHFRQYLINHRCSEKADQIDLQLLREYVLCLMSRNRYAGHNHIQTKADPLSAATVHGHVRTLRAFFGWLTREGLVSKNPAEGLRPPKIPRKVVTVLSDEEIASILGSFSTTNPCDARNKTILMVLLDTGLRIGELIGLNMDDLRLDEGYLKVMGKGQKERIVPIGNNAQRALQRYQFRFRPEPAGPHITNVFLSLYGQPLSANSMKLMFTRLAARSGVARIHAHLCRHTFATRYLMNGGDVFSLEQVLGHSTLEMVKHYTSLTSSHVRMQHQRCSPLDRLVLPNRPRHIVGS